MPQIWTQQDVRDRVRKLTGRKTTGNLGDADLDKAINEYLKNTMAVELPGHRINEVFFITITTVAGQTTQDESPIGSILYIRGNPTCDGVPMTLHHDRDFFYERFPQGQSYENSTPTDILFYGTGFTWMPPAVGGEEIVIPIYPLVPYGVDDAEFQTYGFGRFGRLIAFGTAIDILLDGGDFEAAQTISNVYTTLLNFANRETILSLINQEPVGKW